MQAIILAGGFGTRLKHILPDVPKPMAPIAGVPFLHYMVEYLGKFGIKKFIFSTHYLSEQIEKYFRENQYKFPAYTFKFIKEDEPLGTGGAIIHSIKEGGAKDDVLVINGDTFLKIDYLEFLKAHEQTGSDITLALRKVEDTARYGRVDVDARLITAFREKGLIGEGLINAGNYIINSRWLLTKDFPEKFSFEADFLFPRIGEIAATYFVVDNYFIDIGVPEDYARAQTEIPNHIAG